MNKIPVSVILFLSLLSACDPITTPFDKKPGDVVKLSYEAANEGKYSEAEKLFTDAAKAAMNKQAGGFKRMLDANTKDGTIAEVQIIKEDVRGEGATVIARISYRDGTSQSNDKTTLIKENGSWKITP